MIGLEVEGVEDRAAKLAPFTVGYVVEAKPHPDADRLRVCIVDTGQRARCRSSAARPTRAPA